MNTARNTLTLSQQAKVNAARQFLGRNQTPDPVTLVAARGMIGDLLEVIGALCAGGGAS